MRTLTLILLLSIHPAVASEPFWAMYERDTIAEKKAIWRTLTRDEQVEAQRMNFIWGAGKLDLDGEQRSYLARFSAKLPTITQDELDEFRDNAEILFTENEGKLLFGSIGPYRPCSAFIAKLPTESMLQAATCSCAMTSRFNTCSGNCGPTVCRSTLEGCGFAWLYPCSSLCIAD